MRAVRWIWLVLALAAGHAFGAEVPAGPIWNDGDAREKCPGVCTSAGGQRWNGQWRTTETGRMSVCSCEGGGILSNPVIRYDQTDFVFNDLERTDGKSFEDCANQCIADQRCVAFTLSGAGSCYKKKTTGTLQHNAMATSGFIASRGVPPQQVNRPAAPPTAMPMPGVGGVTRYDATDFPGNDLQASPARSYEDCAQRCVADGRCGAFTFNITNNNCIPKSGAGAPHRDDRAVSGVIDRAAAGAPIAANPGAVGTPNACSVGGTGRCGGCSISCPAAQRPVCTTPIEGVGGTCQRDAWCRCAPN